VGGWVADRLEIVTAAGDVGANPWDGLAAELLELPEQDGRRRRVLLREDHLRVRGDGRPHLAQVRRLIRGHDDGLQDRAAEFGEGGGDRLQERLRGRVGVVTA